MSRSPQVARFFMCSTLIFTFGGDFIVSRSRRRRRAGPLCQTGAVSSKQKANLFSENAFTQKAKNTMRWDFSWGRGDSPSGRV